MENKKEVYRGDTCPYCHSTTKKVSETFVYGKEYSGRMIVVCRNYPICDAYVGCHLDGTPFGRLANKELRSAKMLAHSWFDKIWHKSILSRANAYKKLSEHLKIDEEQTHIGMFDVDECLKVVEFSKNILDEVASKNKSNNKN